MANRKAKVTCLGTTVKGNRCKQTVGLVAGFCSAHRPVVEEASNLLVVCKYTWTTGRKCEEIAIKDGYCNLHRPDNYDTNPVESNANLSVDEGIADILGEIMNHKPEDTVIDLPVDSFQVIDEVGPLHKTGDLVDPSEVFAKYDYLLKYVSMDAVRNKDLFAAYVIKVAGMNYLQAGLEFKSLKSKEDELSAQSKKLTEEAHEEYGRSIPLDIQMDIDALMDEITNYKHKRAVAMAHLDWHESQMEDEVETPVDDKPAFEDVVANFFGGLWDKMKRIVPETLIAVGILLLSLSISALIGMGIDKAPAPAPVHHDTVVEHHSKPVVQHKPVVDVQPTDNVVARHNVSPAVSHMVKAGDTLWDIAKAQYGDGSKWTLIYNANKDKLTRDDTRNVTDAGHWIHAGESLVIPGGDK